MRLERLATYFFAIVLSIGATVTLSSQGQPQPGATLFEGARLITGDGTAPIENSAFVVQNDKITSVGRRGQIRALAGASRIDLSGKTVMPAMINLHTHPAYTNLKSSNAPESYTRENLTDHLQRYAYYGFAAITSMGLDQGDLAFQIRVNPIPGAALYRTSGLGIALPRGGPQGARVDIPYGVRDEAEARKAVQELSAKKVDFVKIWVDDRNGTVQKLPPQIYRPIIDEAHKQNLRVVAHIYALADAKDLLRSGIDGFMHGVRNMEIDEEFMQLVKARPNFFLVPNLPDRGATEDYSWLAGTVRAEEIARMTDAQARRTPEAIKRAQDSYGIQARSLAKLSTAGVRIGFGEDGNGSGWTAQTELADMVAAGMTPAQVIVAATRNSAQILRLDQNGTIAAGKSADFVVLDANPLDNIINTRRISRVYLRGQEVDRAKLQAEWTGRGSRY